MGLVAEPRLRPCHELWGEAIMSSELPALEEVQDAICTPYLPDGRWGVFHPSGEPIESALDRRGPEKGLIGQVAELDTTTSNFLGGEFIYGGRFNNHYGHFLVETVPRLWSISREGLLGRRIVMHNLKPGTAFTYPFAAAIFSSLGLTADDFVSIESATQFEHLAIPAVSYRQQAYAYHVFRDTCLFVGKTLLNNRLLAPCERPTYLSKTRLKGGVGHIVNEPEIESEFARNGVEIIYPEQLTLAEQILLFATRSHIFGTSGSAFHTSIFAPTNGKHIILNPTLSMNSNYALFDMLSGANAHYYWARGTTTLRDGGSFLTARSVPEPAEVVRALLGHL